MTTLQSNKSAAKPTSVRRFYGWYVLGVFWLVLAVNLAFPVYGSGVINTYMAQALGLNAQQLGFSFSVFMAMLGLPAPLIAILIERLGLRVAFGVGALLIAAGSFAMASLVDSAMGAALAFGVLVALGVATGANLATQVGIGRWFVRRRALALSIMFSANGFGGLIAPPLLDVAIARTGDWRAGWWIIGALAIVVGVVAVIIVRDRPEDIGQAPDGDPPGITEVAHSNARVHITSDEFTARAAFRTVALWVIVICVMANFTGLSLVLSHGVPNLRALGHAPATAALAVSLISGGTLAGKLLIGIQGDRIEPRILWSVACCLIGLGLIAAPFATSLGGILAYALPFGIGFGGALVMQTALLLNYFGLRIFGTLIGLVLFSQTLLGAVAPTLAGWMHDRLGDYLLAFISAGALNVFAALLLVFLRPPVMRNVH